MACRQDIRRSQEVSESVEMALVISARSLTHDDRFCPVFLFYPLEFFDDGVQRLIPRDALPLALPLGARSLHGVENPIGMISHLGNGQSLAAQGSVADGGIRVPLHFDYPAVFDVGDNTAASVAAT